MSDSQEISDTFGISVGLNTRFCNDKDKEKLRKWAILGKIGIFRYSGEIVYHTKNAVFHTYLLQIPHGDILTLPPAEESNIKTILSSVFGMNVKDDEFGEFHFMAAAYVNFLTKWHLGSSDIKLEDIKKYSRVPLIMSVPSFLEKQFKSDLNTIRFHSPYSVFNVIVNKMETDFITIQCWVCDLKNTISKDLKTYTCARCQTEHTI